MQPTEGAPASKILITGANSSLGRALIAALAGSATVYAVDSRFDAPSSEAVQITADLRHEGALADYLDSQCAVVHLDPLVAQHASDQTRLLHAVQGTYQLAVDAAQAQVTRLVMAGTQDLFGNLWTRNKVDERWRPRPHPAAQQLAPYLAEVMLREVARVTDLSAICLRLGMVVDAPLAAAGPSDPRWLHVDDAVAAIQRALTVEGRGWQLYHIGAAGDHAALASERARTVLGYAPTHAFGSAGLSAHAGKEDNAVPQIGPRAIRRVVIFGAGGPLGSVVTTALEDDYELLLTDLLPIEALRTAQPQAPGAPLPALAKPPHAWRVVDVCDPVQVHAVCAGADAIINCAVARYGANPTFGVNMVGAYNVMQAAVAHGIQRVVHTGPFMLGDRGAYGYDWDFGVVDDVPPRPGTSWIYFPSKLAGQEICRAFAEHHGLSVPALTFGQFVNPETQMGKHLSALTVSWMDAARAVRAALETTTLPHAFEYFHVGVDLPHEMFVTEKVQKLLNWQPQDRLEAFYTRADASRPSG